MQYHQRWITLLWVAFRIYTMLVSVLWLFGNDSVDDYLVHIIKDLVYTMGILMCTDFANQLVLG
jgi:hypothetical protein